MDPDLSLRGSASLGLSIAELFLDGANLSGEDRVLSIEGIELAWQWVEGDEIDPHELCGYIDGNINLPFRSTLYEPNTIANRAMVVIFLSIGLAAFHACREAKKSPSESVENFGENEWHVLIDISHSLLEQKQASIARIKNRLTMLSKDGGEFGFTLREQILTGTDSLHRHLRLQPQCELLIWP